MPTLWGFIIRGISGISISLLLGIIIRGFNYMGYPYPNFCVCAFWGALKGGLRTRHKGHRIVEAKGAVGLHGALDLRSTF